MRPSARLRTGSALVASLFFVSVLLGLLLLLVGLTRIRSDSGALDRHTRLSRRELQTGLAIALAEIEDSFLVPTNRVYSLPDQQRSWVSTGLGTAVTGLVEEETAEWLGWPERLRGTGLDSLYARSTNATWSVIGNTNAIHTVVAWVGVDLTGLLDPNVEQSLIQTDSLSYTGAANEWYMTAREFSLNHSAADPLFVPGVEVLDEGWFDESTRLWESEVELNGERLSFAPGDWTPDQIEAVMTELFPDRDAKELAQAFEDYWNGREVPTDPEALTAVAVPMINEAVATLTLRNDGTSLTISNRIDFEVWYPFPGNAQTNRYRMPRTPELIRKDTGTPTTFLAAGTSGMDWEFDCPAGDVESAFAVIRSNVSSTSTSFAVGSNLEFEWNLEGLELERVDGSGVVDRLPAGLRLTLPSVAIPPSNGTAQVVAVLEVTDPRINHVFSNWVEAVDSSLTAINAAAVDAQETDEFRDEFVCWVPSASPIPDETDPAEKIGHFPLGDAWRSFDLFAHEGRWWMRHTRQSGYVAGWGDIGLVNPNSLYPEAVGTVFEGAVPRSWPGDSGTALSYLQGVEVAKELEAAVLLDSDSGFTQRGDWNGAVERELLDIAGAASKGRHAAESILVDTLPLLNTRSQVLGIILLTETRGPARQTLSSTRKVYRVARDPFENPDGRRKGRILFVSDLPDLSSGL